jgi:hypothetical protein
MLLDRSVVERDERRPPVALRGSASSVAHGRQTGKARATGRGTPERTYRPFESRIECSREEASRRNDRPETPGRG